MIQMPISGETYSVEVRGKSMVEAPEPKEYDDPYIGFVHQPKLVQKQIRI